VFVGGFIGSPAMNFLEGEVKDDQLHIGDVTVTIPEDRQNILKEKGYNNKKIILGIRPEDIYDANDTDWSNGHNIPITVDVAELMGSETIVYGKVNNQDIVARIEARTGIETGSKMELQFDMANCHFFDPESEERIKVIKVETVAQKLTEKTSNVKCNYITFEVFILYRQTSKTYASISVIIVTSLCICKKEAGTSLVTSPCNTLLKISAFFSPCTSKMIFLASIIVPMPIVIASVGTSSILLKKRAFASIVVLAKSTTCVRDFTSDPGSLNPICPFKPIPKI